MISSHRKHQAASLAMELSELLANEQHTHTQNITITTRKPQMSQLKPDLSESKKTRDMKLGNKQNSIDYKRKKRKAESILILNDSCEEMSCHKTAVSTALIRRQTCRSPNLSTRTIINVLLCMILSKLFCDNLESVIVTAEQQQDAQNIAERFLEEPQDTFALLGHSVELACSVENVRGTISWYREKYRVAFSNSASEVLDRYSLPNYKHPTPANSGTSETEETLYSIGGAVSNFSLRIDPVKLIDDSRFYCRFLNSSGGHQISRSARVTVLKPPTQVNIRTRLVEKPEESSSYLDGRGEGEDNILGGSERGGFGGGVSEEMVLRRRMSQPNELATHNQRQFSTPETLQPQAEPLERFTNQLNDMNAISPNQARVSSPTNWTTTNPRSTSSNEASFFTATVDDYNNQEITRLVVKQNVRLRLECDSDKAKPHAELVWLDNLKQQVPKRHLENYVTSQNNSFVEEKILVDLEEEKLASSSLIWEFRVQRYHQNQVLSCLAKHPAYEQAQLFPHLYGKEPIRYVQLEVEYKPDILGLIKEPSQVYENQSITFQCQAQGRPNDLRYRWFIDKKLVVNATRAELRIERVTRQMHSREIKCQVENSVGASSIKHKLNVRYSPAFVTHLLPDSLQPAPQDNLDQQLLNLPNSNQVKQSTQQHENLLKPLDQAELTIGRQLTLGYSIGQEIQLRCDFDANPRVMQVQWFKVVNEKYSIMGNVTPAEADELIALGEARAQFIKRGDSMDSYAFQSNELVEQEQRRRRQIGGGKQVSDLEEANIDMEQVLLDYELMSENLLDELASYEDQLKQQSVSQPTKDQSAQIGQNFEKIPSQTAHQTEAPINEPIQWVLRQQQQQQQKSNNNNNLALQNTFGSDSQLAKGLAEEPDILSLVPASELLSSSAVGDNSVQLQTRLAQITNSVINLNRTDYESAGKYICRAKTADGSRSVARSIYLVLKGQPRIISNQNQWAPFGASKLQVECLAQTRGVVDNMTSFTWFKEGKPIVINNNNNNNNNKDQAVSGGNSATGMSERSYSMDIRRSPDLLYMRSILHVEGAEFYDFGRYSCLVVNSFGNDTMPINLQPSAPTGFVFAVMASLAIGSVLLLVCILGLLMIFAPQRKLAAKAGSLSNNHHHHQQQQQQQHSNSHSHDISGKSSSSQRSIDSRESLSCNGAGAGIRKEQDFCDNESVINSKQFVLTNNNNNSSTNQQTAAINSMMMLGNQLNSQQHEQTTNSNNTNSLSDQQSDSSDSNSQPKSSLRQPFVATNNSRSTKFAAIHESLEHKLHHMGKPLFSPHHLRQASIDSNGQQQQQQLNAAPSIESGDFEKASQQTLTTNNKTTEAVSELEEASLVNKLWSRLLMRANKNGSRRIKSRPIISMPVNVANGATNQQRQSNIRRSSLSTSLSVLGTESSDTGASADNVKNNNKSLNLNKRVNNGVNHLVSSSANLIQDSTTASDGSGGSSGRSSSNSSGQVNSNELQQVASHQNPGGVHVAYATTGGGGGGYMSHAINNNWQQSVNGNQSPNMIMANGQQQLNGVPMTDCSMYVNEMTDHHLPYLRSQENNNNIYSNEHLTYQNQDPTYAMTNIGYTSQPLGWSDHSQSAPIGHYQHPMPTGDSYFSPGGSMKQQPFYATICNNNNNNKTAPTYGQLFNGANNTITSNNNNNYITLPHRPASTQCSQQRIIPTSDAGDAFFDQNYGTMLSRSKAYTKLGYATSSALSATHYITANSVSSSSSPGSSSHTNQTMPILNVDNITQQIQAVASAGGRQELPNLATSNYTTSKNDMHTTLIQSSTDGGSATTATITKNIDDNGLATHV